MSFAERQGVEIDYCPQCLGVWLDRGELDKLVKISATERSSPQAMPSGAPAGTRPPDFVDSDFESRHPGDYRRKSWLSEIFD
jgi:Zn-finger nucleic acid-binding protein